MSGIVVVGGGLTGLSAAWHLRRAGVAATVLEREAEVGGACRTVAVDDVQVDLTGHLLHLSRDDSRRLLVELGIADLFRRHRRRAGIALGGRVTPYPIQIHTHRLPPEIRRDCVLGFVRAWAGDAADGECESFADWVLKRFGDGFARHFFLPYNRKLYGTDPAELTTEWVGRYVPRPRLEDVLDGAFGLFREDVGYNATFLYPRRGGIGILAGALAAELDDVRTATTVVGVDLERRRLSLSSGEELGWDRLVATLPLTHLAAMTVDLDEPTRRAAACLRAVQVYNLNLVVEGRPPRREHWLYVPEERYPFYRVGLPSNHGTLSPPGTHVLSVEVSLPAGAGVPRGLRERCLAGLEELGLLRRRDAIRTEVRAGIDPSYVVFDAARPAAVAALRDRYRRAGVLLSGRWAEWKYSTMEDALWDGAAAARRVTP